MRRFLLPGLVAAIAWARALSPVGALELAGRYGYAGEWDLAATLGEIQPGAARARSYSGPLRLRHLAVCGPGEAPEKTGEIRLSRLGRERYAATLELGGELCEVAGIFSRDAVAFARCGAQGQIPLRLWLK